jgi:hypothetical protein
LQVLVVPDSSGVECAAACVAWELTGAFAACRCGCECCVRVGPEGASEPKVPSVGALLVGVGRGAGSAWCWLIGER